MHTMCGLRELHSSLRLSSFGERLLALKWRRLIFVIVLSDFEVSPPLALPLKKEEGLWDLAEQWSWGG